MDKNISKDAKSVGSMEPQQTWTIITALDHVLSKAKGSKLCDAFWEACVSPLDYLEKELDLTRQQIVFLSIMAEAGEPISWRQSYLRHDIFRGDRCADSKGMGVQEIRV